MQGVTPKPSSLPEDLTSSEAKLVYFYLATRGSATVDELQASLGMQKLSLYSILQTLDERDLVRLQADEYTLT